MSDKLDEIAERVAAENAGYHFCPEPIRAALDEARREDRAEIERLVEALEGLYHHVGQHEECCDWMAYQISTALAAAKASEEKP